MHVEAGNHRVVVLNVRGNDWFVEQVTGFKRKLAIEKHESGSQIASNGGIFGTDIEYLSVLSRNWG